MMTSSKWIHTAANILALTLSIILANASNLNIASNGNNLADTFLSASSLMGIRWMALKTLTYFFVKPE
jgi:hypothetical protein